MENQQDHLTPNQITYACYSKKVREGEQFIPEHVFSYQISGSLVLKDGVEEHVFKEDSFRLIKRNTLIKFTKLPAAQADYRNLSVTLDQQTLKDLSLQYGYRGERQASEIQVFPLSNHKLLSNYINSLPPYDELLNKDNFVLRSLKVKELVLLLLKVQPGLLNVLFDFTEPGKIDLEAFMNKNFRFNVSLERFAYLTGRSLSTFKRDFEKVFFIRPGKWLQQKRLEEAYYLIKNKKVAPSEVYVDVGFEDLSHFSYAFKKMFGTAPTKIGT
jgi:AraC-like DNA-binding protein